MLTYRKCSLSICSVSFLYLQRYLSIFLLFHLMCLHLFSAMQPPRAVITRFTLSWFLWSVSSRTKGETAQDWNDVAIRLSKLRENGVDICVCVHTCPGHWRYMDTQLRALVGRGNKKKRELAYYTGSQAWYISKNL